MSLDRSFPIQRLLFFVAQDITASIRVAIERLVANIAESRQWVIGPPQFVDQVEECDEAERCAGDLPIETVGGVLEIYSALSPTILPREIDLQHFDEVSALVKGVCNFSLERSVRFEFELDGDSVGIVENGKMDRCLAEGLLGEWKRVLDASG